MILVVDDIVDVAMGLTRLLQSLGYPAMCVDAGAKALVAIRAHPSHWPLLVVLDVEMPEMSGIDVLTQLRAHRATAGTAVVMHSGSADDQHRESAQRLGIAAWLVKGRDPEVTINTITRSYEELGGVKTR